MSGDVDDVGDVGIGMDIDTAVAVDCDVAVDVEAAGIVIADFVGVVDVGADDGHVVLASFAQGGKPWKIRLKCLFLELIQFFMGGNVIDILTIPYSFLLS